MGELSLQLSEFFVVFDSVLNVHIHGRPMNANTKK